MKKHLVLVCAALVVTCCGRARADWQNPTFIGNLADATAPTASITAHDNDGALLDSPAVVVSGNYTLSYSFVADAQHPQPYAVNAYSTYETDTLTATIGGSGVNSYANVNVRLTVTVGSATTTEVDWTQGTQGVQATRSLAAITNGQTGTTQLYPSCNNGTTLNIITSVAAHNAAQATATALGASASASTGTSRIHQKGSGF